MRFFRPSIKPLNLDLAKLRCVGSCPTQGYGETHDGRQVYIGYRGGRLSVELQNPDEMLLEAHFGDRYDGTLLLGQICDLTGITINGQKPPIDERPMREEGVPDWSGKYVHWSFQLNYTAACKKAFLADLGREFPGLCINHERVEQRRAYHRVVRKLTDDIEFVADYFLGLDKPVQGMLDGGPPHYDGDYGIACGKVLRLNLPSEVRSSIYLMHNQKTGETDWIERRKHSAEGMSAIMAEYGILWPTYEGIISGTIHANNSAADHALMRIEAVVERHFGNKIKLVDLESGEVLNRYESIVWYCHDQIDWCDVEKKRFLSTSRGRGQEGRIVAQMPDC
ncbi:hypothetical protein [Rhizobium sp. BK491]|uniref:hypothetical protein n=1 Tax=Rhizobium sp. BK491 TaxID=2587009 RepID=UPI0016091FD6|nr:hypothetical protein [Rhizobium sp. BK491]MBB3571784.1 hypothetical protein [Rhizobium sp. BK491]